MPPATRASTGSADRKAVLFCPACGHEAPLDGDWTVHARDGVDSGRTDVACPGCGEVVVSQPRFAGLDGRGGPTAVFRPLSQLLHAVVRHDVL